MPKTKQEIRFHAIQVVLSLPIAGERSVAQLIEDVKLVEAFLLELADPTTL